MFEVLAQEGLRSTKLLDLLPIVGSEEPTTIMPHARG